jgi:hypothetical protein
MNKEINIGREIDLVIKQANRFIAYKNKSSTWEHYCHEYLEIANKSQLKQNFNYMERWLKAQRNQDANEFLNNILDFDSLISVIAEQDHSVTNAKYSWAQTYWNDAKEKLDSTVY